ncbi:MAG: hypothetical protein EAX90_14245 [Candidatus Heimdallarchaeota archaeon]|nr:hypothetical protein [Candidatus Heimdallarchaeota archaeon]
MSKEILNLTKKLLEGSKEGSRVEAAKSLGKLEEEAQEAVPALIKALHNDKSDRVRGRAALALGRINDKNAVPELIHALQIEENLIVRSRIAWALGDLDKLAVEAIEPLRIAAKEEKNKDRKFYFDISIVKIEGSKSEELKELLEMKEEGKLETWQIIRLQNILKEIDLQDKVKEASEGIANVREGAKSFQAEVTSLREKVQLQPESNEKRELLNVTTILQRMIDEQQKTIERQEETIKGLNQSLQELVKTHQQAILEPRISAEQFQEFKESEPKESWIKRNLFGFIGALGTIISSVIAILGWLSGALGWFG